MMPNYIDDNQSKIKSPDKPPVLVASATSLESMRQAISAEPLVAIDTESDSLFSYFEKVCLLQFSIPTQDFIVDPLAVENGASGVVSLAAFFADPQIEKVFHAAEYDILCLKRDYQFSFAQIFDTMIAARILGWKNVGLGSILQERFGVTLNKKMQRADWGARPLTAEQIAYAREDTHFLLRLRDLQVQELEKAERLAEAREEFERLCLIEASPRKFDLDGYWNIDGARELSPRSLGVLRELYHARDTQAKKEDRPPFKVLSDSALVHIATECPSSPRALTQLHGVSEYIIRRYSTWVLGAVTRGVASLQMSQPRPRARAESALDNGARNRLGKLKEWRKARAAKRGVEPDVIVSNDVLYAVARRNPRTLEALVEVSKLGPWKTKEYGEELITVLHGKRR